MRAIRSLVAVGLLAATVGCAGTTAGADGQRPGRSAAVITAEELQAAPPTQNAFDLIRGLRPQWLQARGVQTLGSPVEVQRGERVMTQGQGGVLVYLDGSRQGGAEVLRQILVSQMLSLQFMSATEASSRFGTDHPGGAILVTTRR